MKRIVIVCEGQTEEGFVTKVLAPSFDPNTVFVQPQLVNTSPGHKGGGLNYERVRKHLRNTLCEKSATVVTTLFDLYGLDKTFPDIDKAKSQNELGKKLDVLKAAFHADIVRFSGCEPERFIPYFQPHEFEALLFSDLAALRDMEPLWTKHFGKLLKIFLGFDSPEHVNDRPQTKPAKLLETHFEGYQKTLHGPMGAARIELPKIEAKCSFFRAWIEQLRRI